MSSSSLFIAGLVLFTMSPGRSAEAPRSETRAAAKVLRAGDLLLRELTHPPGLFVWTVLQNVDDLDASRLRVLARDVREAQRRGCGLAAAPLVMEAAAERDLPGTLRDMLMEMELESSSAVPRAGIENDAALLACRMTGREWAKLLPLLDGVKREAPFWRQVAAGIELPPEKMTVFLTTAARGMEAPQLADIAGRVLWTTVKHHGVAATAKAVKTIRNPRIRTTAQEALVLLKKDPPLPPSPLPDKSPPLKSPPLRRLLALDTAPGEPRRIPFSLLHAVRQLSPVEALTLAKELPRDPAPPGHWLAWMLFMRAAEGDAPAAAAVATETGGQLIRAGQPAATLFALRREMEATTALQEIRSIVSPEAQRQALSGCLTGPAAQSLILGQQGNPLLAFAMQTKLPAACWRAGLCQAAASGGGEAALLQARNLPWEPPVGRATLQEDIIKAWALTDLPTLQSWAAKLTNPDEIKPVTTALAFLAPLLPVAAE